MIARHKAEAAEVVIVSSSGEEVVEHDRCHGGAERRHRHRMVVEDGKYTGELATYVYGPARPSDPRVRRAPTRLGECYAYYESIYRPSHARGGLPIPSPDQADRAMRQDDNRARLARD